MRVEKWKEEVTVAIGEKERESVWWPGSEVLRHSSENIHRQRGIALLLWVGESEAFVNCSKDKLIQGDNGIMTRGNM